MNKFAALPEHRSIEEKAPVNRILTSGRALGEVSEEEAGLSLFLELVTQ